MLGIGVESFPFSVGGREEGSGIFQEPQWRLRFPSEIAAPSRVGVLAQDLGRVEGAVG